MISVLLAIVSICGMPRPPLFDPLDASNASGSPSIRAKPATEQCMKAAAEDMAPNVSIAIRRLSQERDFIKVALSFENLTDSPIWMNLKPVSLEGSGLASDQQLFVTIHAPQEKTGRGIEYDASPSRNSSYGIVGSHKRHDLVILVNGIGFDLQPGAYRVDACFSDRSRVIPKPPQGAIVVKGPVGVSQMVTVTSPLGRVR